MRGGHADTKKDREIKKDMRGDEKEEHEASYTHRRVLFLKNEPPGSRDGFSCFLMHTHTLKHTFTHKGKRVCT